MEKYQKIKYFEYVIYKLLNWHMVDNGFSENDFSTLKLMKLLFFVSAAEANSNSESLLLDNVFNNFVAMPYGHVESDVYEVLREKGGQLEHYAINNSTTIALNSNFDIADLNSTYVNAIDSAVDYLKRTNNKLINLTKFDLVNLSHAWYSWQHFYELAFLSGKKSYSIPKESIKSEDKIYSLNLF